jgi:hypothetical protein
MRIAAPRQPAGLYLSAFLESPARKGMKGLRVNSEAHIGKIILKAKCGVELPVFLSDGFILTDNDMDFAVITSNLRQKMATQGRAERARYPKLSKAAGIEI